MLKKLTGTSNSFVFTIMRLALGVVFFAHGAGKMLGWWGGVGFANTMGYFTHFMHIPAPFAFLVICAEFFGGLGLLVGFLSRIAAFSLFVDMLVALFLVHIHYGFFMNWQGTKRGEGFEYHILALALLFAILVSGGGALSVDRLISGRSSKA
ncbi:MAG: DoxX family protein [Acidobacteriota bacterium]|nr:DoxX family protein [Acidobacteriota bacterium]